VSLVASHGFKPSDIFFYLSSPQIVPCLSLLGGAPPGSRSLKPDEKVSMPSFGWLVAWSIWRERNWRVHEREDLMLVAHAPVILNEARTWARAGFLPVALLLDVRPLGHLLRFSSFSFCLLFLCNLLNLV
jgi:hypothetical protein